MKNANDWWSWKPVAFGRITFCQKTGVDQRWSPIYGNRSGSYTGQFLIKTCLITLSLALGKWLIKSRLDVSRGTLPSALITEVRDLFRCTVYLYTLTESTYNLSLKLLYICVTRNTSVTKKRNVTWGSVTVRGIQQEMESSVEVSCWKQPRNILTVSKDAEMILKITFNFRT